MHYSASTGGFYDHEIHGESMPLDVVEISSDAHRALLMGQVDGLVISANEDGVPHLTEPLPPTVASIKLVMAAAVQAYIDAPAQAWGYDSAASAVTYVTDSYPKFRGEGQAILDFRSSCWKRSGEILLEVELGARAMPSKSELLSELPPPPERPAFIA